MNGPGTRVLLLADTHSALDPRIADLAQNCTLAVHAVLYGHSHRLLQDLAPAPWLLNPGAAGCARTHGGPSCLVLEAGGGDWQITAHRFPVLGRAGRRS